MLIPRFAKATRDKSDKKIRGGITLEIMGLSTTQQIFELIEKSNKIVIALPKNPSTDAIASSLAFYIVLEKMEKKVTAVCAEFELPPSHQFLPKSKAIYSDFTALRKFIIILDLSKTKVKELSYEIIDDKLNIFITPKSGFFDKKDISCSASMFDYDLIIVIDSADLETLGKLHDDNTEFFYHTPIINIDHKPNNEYFGQINLVDLVATSTSEIVFDLIKDFRHNLMDEYIATSLLTGIISKTKSFQSATVTPKSLAVASHLIEQGARRDEIIKNLYQTKSISTLKLWGRALARLKTDFNSQVVWSLLNREDFEKSGAKENELEGVIDELIVNTPDAKIILIFYEKSSGEIEVLVNTIKAIDSLILFKELDPKGSKNFTRFTIKNKDLIQTEKEILEKIKIYLEKI